MSGGLRPPILKFSFQVGDVWVLSGLDTERGILTWGVMSGHRRGRVGGPDPAPLSCPTDKVRVLLNRYKKTEFFTYLFMCLYWQ